MKTFLENVSSYFPLNTKLALLLLFSLLMFIFTPGLLKAAFFLLTVVSGTCILYFNRDRLAQAEKSKPINGKIHFTLTLLMIAMVLGAFVFSYKLGAHDIREDEFQVISAAAGYYYEGDFYTWNWLEGEPSDSIYDRAFPHTFLIAQAYNLFGISEWSSRLVSVLFGILFIPVLYLTARFFTEDNYLALLAVFIAIFYEYHIFIFRYARMYALLIPIFLILVYFIYKGLTESSLISGSANKLYKLIYSNFNYNYCYAVLALIFLYFGYLIHINALVIIPAAWLFVFLMFYRTKEKKYLSLSLIGLAGLLYIVLAYYFDFPLRHTGHVAFFERSNFEYLEYLTRYPFPWEISSVLLAFGLVAALLLNGSIKNKLLYLYTIVLFSLYFFIFIGDRYSLYWYVSHIAPISMILILFTCFLLLRAINSRIVNIYFACLLLLYVGTNFYYNIDTHYGDKHRYGSHSRAYETIIDNYDPENEVIFGQYLRTFYLQDLKHKEVETVSMLSNKRYSFETFVTDLQKFDAGWLTWETRKSRHLEQDIIDFIDTHFEKLHGQGVDDLKVEVYYYQQQDLRDIE